MSKRTKQCKRLSILFSTLHFLCLFGPFFYFIPFAFVNGVFVEKITLSLTLIFSLGLAGIAILVDAKTRGGMIKTIMWLTIMGITCCLKSIAPFIYIMASISIIDELFIVRAKTKYKDAYAANREIDRRG